jgi:hypothetical protein
MMRQIVPRGNVEGDGALARGRLMLCLFLFLLVTTSCADGIALSVGAGPIVTGGVIAGSYYAAWLILDALLVAGMIMTRRPIRVDVADSVVSLVLA